MGLSTKGEKCLLLIDDAQRTAMKNGVQALRRGFATLEQASGDGERVLGFLPASEKQSSLHTC